MSRRARLELSTVNGASSDAALDREVWAITTAEVEKGWLLGPYTTAELDAALGSWTPSRRFGVRQSGKVRAIDDFAASRVNEGLSAQEPAWPVSVASGEIRQRSRYTR